MNLKFLRTKWIEHRSEIADIRSKEEAEKISSLIFQTIKELKAREDVDKLYLDLTGGRKEMSSYLMMSAQLLCTEGDKLYHVEVNDPEGPLQNRKHENFENYYYPKSPDEITLISVPFVSLKKLFQVIGASQKRISA